MSVFSDFKIDSGTGLYNFIRASGLEIKSKTGLDGTQNTIIITDLTSFNWKTSEDCIRVNCKKEAMQSIELKTELRHFDNGKGDPTRPYSFYVRSLDEFIDIIYILKHKAMKK